MRKGLLSGDILGGIFEPIALEAGASPEFPLDFISPGSEKDFVAYTIPNHGRIPERHVEGDYVIVPTYDVGASIDYMLKYARDARWDVVGRAMEVMETVMRRNGGGNSSSLNRGSMTDLYVSPEAMEDIRNWGVDQVDETTRREIYVANDGAINRVFGVNLQDLDELGEQQEYQKFYENELAASVASGDKELVVGLDQSTNDAFVMPVRQDVQIFEDDQLHRQKRAGFYGWAEIGFGVLDNRRVLLGSL